MNQRDIPEIVAELIYEMHEVRTEVKEMKTDIREMKTELQAINGRLDRLDNTMGQVVGELRAMPEQIGTSVMRALEPFLNRLLDNNDQLKNHEGRLKTLENPSA